MISMKIIMKNFLKTEIRNVLDEVRITWIENENVDAEGDSEPTLESSSECNT